MQNIRHILQKQTSFKTILTLVFSCVTLV